MKLGLIKDDKLLEKIPLVDKDINGYKIGKYKNIIATDGNIFIY